MMRFQARMQACRYEEREFEQPKQMIETLASQCILNTHNNNLNTVRSTPSHLNVIKFIRI